MFEGRVYSRLLGFIRFRVYRFQGLVFRVQFRVWLEDL